MTNLSRQTVWLPDGEWFDFFSGEYFQGGKWYNIYGDLSDFPLFAKAGAIIPLAAEAIFGETANPEILNLEVFPGADNQFKLYEDNGAASEAELKTAKTIFKLKWQPDQISFEIEPLKGEVDVIPGGRSLQLKFRALSSPKLELWADDKIVDSESNYDQKSGDLMLTFDYNPEKSYQIIIKNNNGLMRRKDLRVEKIKRMLKNFKLETVVKTELAQSVEKAVRKNKGSEFLDRFQAVLSQSQLKTVIEIIYSCGSARIKNANTDQILIFRGDLEEMSYNFSKAVLSSGHHRASMENQRQKVDSYQLLDLKALDTDKWQLSLNYTDFIKEEYKG
jgi:hypothetical protein